MKKLNLIWLSLFTLVFYSCQEAQQKEEVTAVNWNNEVVYHVMQRSFYDSNGDGHGDLNGFVQKLDYLQELGITTILFTPLYESDFYHNYFPIDYEAIDPEYGTMEEYIAFVEAVHQRGMKFIMDMETQYVQNGNLWFEESYMNPESPYSDFIYYSDEENRYPQQFLRPEGSDIYEYQAWPDQKLNIFHLDMNNQALKDWMTDYYAYWTDPRGDGSLIGGVDGFRIDHIMDDLDYMGLFTNLYSDFWKPIFDHVKTINPNLFIVGEQSNWAEYGGEMIEASGADASFGFMIRYAIADIMAENPPAHAVNHTAANIGHHVTQTVSSIPDDKYFIHFLENHDIDRWASIVGRHQGRLRCGAVLNMVLPGIPSIYYGQELGVTGLVQEWNYDVNHIPVREAFPWTPNHQDTGTAAFYRETGPWWDMSYFMDGKANEFALSVQKDDPESLWNLYREMIHFRKDSDALSNGDFQMIQTGEDNMFAFTRETDDQKVTVFMNLSQAPITLNTPDAGILLYQENSAVQAGTIEVSPYGFLIYQD